MEKRISQKMILAISAIVIALIAIVAVVFIIRGTNKTYRSIKIVELEGDVNIDREGVNGINASVNMNLVSGDRLTTGQDAYVVLCLDTDKYVMLGEYGSMKVNAEGKENASRTSVELEAGSVLSEIQNPLGKDSTYDIVTPNATMSVRGTVFEVRKDMQEKDISVLVYDGCVAVAPTGMDPVEYHAGEYTVFTDSNPAVFVTEKSDITGEQINEQMLERLKKIEHNGRTLNLDAMMSSVTEISEAPEESISEKISEKFMGNVEKPEEPDAEPSPEKNNVTSGNKTNTVSKKDNAAEEPAPEQETPETTPQNNSGGSSSSGKKKKPKPSEENKEPGSSETGSSETPTESSTETSTESSSEESSEPENEKISVKYYLPYIALWGEDFVGNYIYSTIMDYEPILAGENHDIIKGSKLQKPADVTVGMTQEGWINEKKDLKHVGWCTGDCRQWDFDADVAAEDIILYPIWQDSQGRKYYPCFYSTGTKTYPCNSIIEGSVPEI